MLPMDKYFEHRKPKMSDVSKLKTPQPSTSEEPKSKIPKIDTDCESDTYYGNSEYRVLRRGTHS